MYFPTTGGWRIKEQIATVTFLKPVSAHHSLMERIGDHFKEVSPLIGDAGELAKLAPLPGASGVGTLLSTMAKLQVNSVPQVGGFEWSIGKVTFVSRRRGFRGAMQGVMWTLPPNMFTELGGRLTRSLAVSFIAAQRQQSGSPASAAPAFQPLPLLAHAVAYGPEHGPDNRVWVPGSSVFLELSLAPRPPAL